MAEGCAMIQISEIKQFLLRIRNVERRFGIRIRVPGFKPRSRSGSEIVIIGVSGPSENTANAIEYVEMFSFGEFPSSISYPSELKRVFDDYTWLDVLETLEKVVVRVDPRLCKLVITGKNSTSVSRATSLVRELISSFTSPVVKSGKGTEKLVDILSANIPEKLKSSFEALLDLPAQTQALLVSWVKRAYKLPERDVKEEEHRNSVLMLDDSVVVVPDTAADDSVIVIEEVPKEVPVITISDDENIEESVVEREREEGVQKARDFARRGLKRKFEETSSNKRNMPVARNGESSAGFLPFDARRNKKYRTKPDVEVLDAMKPSVPKRLLKQRVLRPVVIDGSNVAREHGKPQNVFSCRGILLSVEYFLNRGHESVVAFVPQFRRKHSKANTIDQHILEELASKQLVVFTPSRFVAGKTICSYDDRFIVKLAAEKSGVILSNDNFRDLVDESPEWRRAIQERLLMYCFVGDMLMIPDDPLGKDGPSLDEFLSFPDPPRR